jgi:hypothetical protein
LIDVDSESPSFLASHFLANRSDIVNILLVADTAACPFICC